MPCDQRVGDVLHKEAALLLQFPQGGGPDPGAGVDPHHIRPQFTAGLDQGRIGPPVARAIDQVGLEGPVEGACMFQVQVLVGVEAVNIGFQPAQRTEAGVTGAGGAQGANVEDAHTRDRLARRVGSVQRCLRRAAFMDNP